MMLQAPVFRELYSEKRVVAEERRSRIDNAPLGRFQEDFARACLTNNYGRPVIGEPLRWQLVVMFPRPHCPCSN